MSANRTIVLIGVLLAAVALLAATGPAMAHSSAPLIEPVRPTAEAPILSVSPSPVPAVAAPADSSGFTAWIAAGPPGLAGAALRRRPPRVPVPCLAPPLAALPVENAPPSVP